MERCASVAPVVLRLGLAGAVLFPVALRLAALVGHDGPIGVDLAVKRTITGRFDSFALHRFSLVSSRPYFLPPVRSEGGSKLDGKQLVGESVRTRAVTVGPPLPVGHRRRGDAETPVGGRSEERRRLGLAVLTASSARGSLAQRGGGDRQDVGEGVAVRQARGSRRRPHDRRSAKPRIPLFTPTLRSQGLRRADRSASRWTGWPGSDSPRLTQSRHTYWPHAT